MSLMEQTNPSPIKSLGARKFNRLLELARRFNAESQRCARVRAYYAACILQGAALEGMLMAMVECHPEDVKQYLATLPSRDRPKGQLTKWTLNELVKIAIGLNWIPARRGKYRVHGIGDWLNYVRDARNLVHLGRHLRDYPNLRIRSKHFLACSKIVSAAISHLSQIVESEIVSEIDHREQS